MIWLDSAVGSKQLAGPLQQMGLPVEVTQVPGDIAFLGRGEGGAPVSIGIEYKKLGELVTALRTQRLQGHQAVKMQYAYDYNYLVYVGELLYDRQGYLMRRAGRRTFKRLPGSMTVSELFKRLFVLQLEVGLTPINVHSQPDSLKIIEALYHTWTDQNQDQHKSHIAIYQPAPLIPISQFRQTVATLPGIGVALSRRVEQHFEGKLLRAFDAPVSEWAKIEGIGVPTAERIINAIRKESRTVR